MKTLDNKIENYKAYCNGFAPHPFKNLQELKVWVDKLVANGYAKNGDIVVINPQINGLYSMRDMVEKIIGQK